MLTKPCYGNIRETIPSGLTYMCAVLQQKLTDKVHYVLQHDRGWQENPNGMNTGTADWYSVVQYLTYKMQERVGVGLRAEWFRDQNGFRYQLGESSLFALTAGLNWQPMKWLTIRPEVCYDWADAKQAVYVDGPAPSINDWCRHCGHVLIR